MRITDLCKNKKKPTLSFEIFPARSKKAEESLEKVIKELASLKPDFVSVTFGAGGSTREGSRQLVEKLKKEYGLEVVAYFAGYGLCPNDIISVLESYKKLEVETILVVRGDPPHDNKDFITHPESFKHASELIEFIKSRFDFCIGAAGYPEGHIEAENKEKDLEYLKLKVTKGANYIMTNYCYDNRYFFDFIKKCGDKGIETLIIPGVMPIYSIKMMENLAKICGATITEEIKEKLSQIKPDDKEAIEKFGIDFAAKQCRELIKSGVPGIHIYTMDRSSSSKEIVTILKNEGLL